MAQPRIFVSYSRKDDAFTRRIVEDLHQAGAEVWVDVSGISHGNFMQRIDEALERCEWMVLILTPSAIESQYVRDEVYTALHRVKQGHMRDVIPVLAAPCASGAIPPQWDVLQRYDATTNYTSALAGVFQAIGLSPNANNATTENTTEFTEEAGEVANEETADDLVARGRTLAEQDDWVQAISCFRQAARLDDTSVLAWEFLGWALNAAGRHAEGLVACNRALALDSQEAWVWNVKGCLLCGLKRDEEAVIAFDQALTLAPEFTSAWSGKGNSLNILGRSEQALVACDQALALDPNFTHAWEIKGETLHILQRDEEAIEAYDCALASDPNYIWALNNKAVALRALGREAEAQEAERKAKELGE